MFPLKRQDDKSSKEQESSPSITRRLLFAAALLMFVASRTFDMSPDINLNSRERKTHICNRRGEHNRIKNRNVGTRSLFVTVAAIVCFMVPFYIINPSIFSVYASMN
jgi:hypothetical protein